jgi:hypothetical protein
MQGTMVTIPKDISRPIGGDVTPIANAYFETTFNFVTAGGVLSDEELGQAALDSGTFDFWKSPGEDVYSLEDGEPV